MTAFSSSLELTRAIGARIVASPDVIALVPADAIIDGTGRPEKLPCIILGEAQTVPARFLDTVHLTLHVWFRENGLVQSKLAAAAIVAAVRADAQVDGPLLTPNFSFTDCRATNVQHLRDPHGDLSHAVITVTAIAVERAV